MHPPYECERKSASAMAVCNCSQPQIRNMLIRDYGCSWVVADTLATEALDGVAVQRADEAAGRMAS